MLILGILIGAALAPDPTWDASDVRIDWTPGAGWPAPARDPGDENDSAIIKVRDAING